jgi:hypothetical protein
MTATVTLLGRYRLSINTKKPKHIKRHRYQLNLLQPAQIPTHHCILSNFNTMSQAFIHELDRKMQQVREYALIAHGYRNENIQYPIHVRRSHDGEKLPQTASIHSKSGNYYRKNRFPNSTILTPSFYENRTKSKQKELTTRQLSYDERHTTITVPPNKTVNDINPSFNCDRLHTYRKSSLSSLNSSPNLCSSRPHSIAGISLSTTDDQQRNLLSNSFQSLPTKTLTQRFFSKLFHHPSKF